MEPIPLMPKIFFLVVEQERKLFIVVLVTNIHSVNVSHIVAPNNMLCNLCGQYGHIKNVCFQKVGFPTIDTRNSKFNSTRKLCTYCDRTGHTIDTCYKKHEFPWYKFHTTNQTTQVHNLVTNDDVFP